GCRGIFVDPRRALERAPRKPWVTFPSGALKKLTVLRFCLQCDSGSRPAHRSACRILTYRSMTMTSTRQTMSESKPIPQMDLAAQYAAIGGEIRKAVTQVLTSQQFVLGKEGAALEREIAELSGVQHGIGVASGTDALILALRAAGVAADDEVILPPFTFVATGSAVSALGAKPVFADIDSETFNVHPDEISKRVTPRTRAILVVHLYGLAADIDPIRNTATRHGIPVIEDNAQAIGARYKGNPTGALGDIACVRFYPI